MRTNLGLKYWIIVLCCCGLAASSVGAVVNTVGVFYAPVSESLGVMRGTFALSATLMMIATATISLFVPRILELFSLKKTLLMGAIFVFVSTLLMGFTNNIYLFYLLGIIKGIGAGMYGMLPITMIINHWFELKHGFATSVVLSFSGVAGAILSPILASLITSMGWQNTYILLAIVGLVLALPAVIYPFTLDPLQEGKLPYGAKEAKEAKDKGVEKTTFSYTNPLYLVFILAAVLLTAITGMASHFPGYSESIQMSTQVGALMLSGCMVGNISSKLIIGVLSDLMGILKSVLVMIVANIIAIVLIMTIHSSYVLIVSSVLFGSIYSVGAVGIALLTRYFFGGENYGKAYSMVSFATNIGAAFAMTLIGFVYDLFNTYNIALLSAIIFDIVALFIFVMMSRRHHQ